VVVKEAAAAYYTKLQKAVAEAQKRILTRVKDPQFQTCTVVTAVGTVTFAAAGGAFGLATGVVTGAAAGVVPALLTFGVSIPVAGAVGGGVGLCTGTLLGGGAGGVSSLAIYRYRVEIRKGLVTVKVKAQNGASGVQLKLKGATAKGGATVDELVKLTHSKVDAAIALGKTKLGEASAFSKEKAVAALTFATTTRPGVTATATAAGTLVGGVSGGAAGTLAGAAVGLVPAIFTFGFSIPVCAAAGLCIGTTTGGACGAVCGGAAGYGGFTYKKARASILELKKASMAKMAHVNESVKSLVSGTGGSA